MKVKRNYRFVLTVVSNSLLEAGEVSIAEDSRTGEYMFDSECHYYAEKELISAVKDAERIGRLSDYFGHTYCIYKEDKPKVVTETRVENNKKIIEVTEIPGKAQLVEVITISEEGMDIR